MTRPLECHLIITAEVISQSLSEAVGRDSAEKLFAQMTEGQLRSESEVEHVLRSAVHALRDAVQEAWRLHDAVPGTMLVRMADAAVDAFLARFQHMTENTPTISPGSA